MPDTLHPRHETNGSNMQSFSLKTRKRQTASCNFNRKQLPICDLLSLSATNSKPTSTLNPSQELVRSSHHCDETEKSGTGEDGPDTFIAFIDKTSLALLCHRKTEVRNGMNRRYDNCVKKKSLNGLALTHWYCVNLDLARRHVIMSCKALAAAADMLTRRHRAPISRGWQQCYGHRPRTC